MKPRACPDCLRRSWLLAPYIERYVASDSPRSLWELLGFSDEALAETVAPKVAGQSLARAEAITPRRAEEELDVASCWATCVHDDLYPSHLAMEGTAPGL